MTFQPGRGKIEPLNMKQKFLLTLFLLEVVIYPFVIASELTGESFSSSPENPLWRRGIIIMFVWVPVAVMCGFLLGKRLRNNLEIVNFFRKKDVSPDEIPPLIGIFAPLSVITAALVIRAFYVCLLLWFITIPIYLIIRFWKKKGIKHLLRWIFMGVMKLAIRMKRMSYIGYLFPILFGWIFAHNITKNTQTNAGGAYILILIQMVVLIALWKYIRNPEREPSPEPSRPDLPPQQFPKIPGYEYSSPIEVSHPYQQQYQHQHPPPWPPPKQQPPHPPLGHQPSLQQSQQQPLGQQQYQPLIQPLPQQQYKRQPPRQ